MTNVHEQKHILIVDDEEAVCWALQRALTHEGHAAAVAASAEEAFTLAVRQRPDVIVLDVRLPGMDGLAALARLRELAGGAPVIVVTAFGNLDTAVHAVRAGAFEYLTKPFDLQQALDAVARALQRQAFQEQPVPETAAGAVDQEEIIGHSPAMQAVFRRIALVAPRDACVLITGESGTGKELVARAIHRYSPRGQRPFLPVHLAALNPNLVESELFGHAKGAFTGAVQHRPGLLELADGGTLFLDELADVPLSVQVKLLRFLEHGEVFPVGENQPRRLNVRILAATHQDLFRKVEAGTFRHDLFFRLNVFQVHLPPLRERPEDIPLLVQHFLGRLGAGAVAVPDETLRFLSAQSWPGNVRELRNALEHAVILTRAGPLLPECFPARTALVRDPVEQLADAVRHWVAWRVDAEGGNSPGGLHPELLGLVEGTLLADVIARVRGNRWEAARWLGLNRTTVRKRLAEHQLTEADTDKDETGEAKPGGDRPAGGA